MEDPTTTFTPCPSRFYDIERDEAQMYGCLLPVEDGHTLTPGPAHRNHGHSWSFQVAVKAPRCESIIGVPRKTSDGVTVLRCVEDAGHYLMSPHQKNGWPTVAWTDQMSLNPPVTIKPDPDATCGDRFVSPGDQREDAYVCDGRAGHLDKDVMHGGQNPAGKTAAWGAAAGLKDHPDEPTLIKLSKLREQLIRAADLVQHKQGVIDELAARLEDQHRRTEGLRQAVAWFGKRNGVSRVELADYVEAFERYLLDGTAVNTPLPLKGPSS